MKDKKKLLFVCLGNICRSPAAEGIMKHLVEEAGLENDFFIDSAGTSGWHEGELPDSRMRSHAKKRGYDLNSLSRPVRSQDFDNFDMILAMDDTNYTNLMRQAPSPEAESKIYRMTDFCKKKEADHVPDPYYSGADGFEIVLDILEDACSGLLEEIKTKNRGIL
ncbi:MAG: low molecular weight phosphotyrosine protein phosphatase [Candidatus Azobacteroides sp.]|nr:low molecular weight phosphotyrosine protein phosphatase [Candidatus Azobacteroides sp.]